MLFFMGIPCVLLICITFLSFYKILITYQKIKQGIFHYHDYILGYDSKVILSYTYCILGRGPRSLVVFG